MNQIVSEQELATKIIAAHGKVTKALQSSLKHAKDAGASLAMVQANKTAKHFIAWCKKECGISESTALCYIRIHKHWQEVEGEANYTSALKALRTTRKTTKTAAANIPLNPFQDKLADAMARYCIKGTLVNMELFLADLGYIKPLKIAS